MQAIKKRLLDIPHRQESFALIKAFETLFGNQVLGSAGLAINAGTAATWKMTNAAPLVYTINGATYTKAALTAQAIPASAALTASGNQAVAVMLCLDAGGTLSTYVSAVSTGASVAAAVSGVIYPQVPENVAVIGVIIIGSAATAFTPGTTALDAAGITTTYINVTGPFFPIPPV